MQQAVAELFDRYARETNRALAGQADVEAISKLYADSFIASSPQGVMTGSADKAFAQSLADGFDRYRAMGTRSMTIAHIRTEAIDALHAVAHVDWRAVYNVETGEKQIDFKNVYLVRADDDGAKVFGWITGDEESVLREHGIID